MGFGLEKLNGLFSGAKIGSTFLPSNDLIRQYGIGDGSLFRVKMSAYKNTEIKLSGEAGAIKVDSEQATSPLAEFEVLHNAESLTVSHSHEWGESQGVAGLLTKAFNRGFMGLVSGTTVLNTLKGAQDLKENKSAQVLTEFNSWGGLDVAETYRGNSRPEFTVRFVLLATSNPLTEVIIPALMFTYLSYPTLSKEKDMSKFLASMESKLDSGVNELVGSISTNKQAEGVQEQAASVLEESYKAMKGAASGKWRYRMGDAPPFWVVSSSNGIIYLPNCHISNITVDYFGPWIEAPDKSSIANLLSGALSSGGKSGIGLDPSAIFPNSSSIIGSNLFKTGKHGALGGYPTYANVSITFRHAFDKIFGEEWLLSMNGAASQFGSTSSAG